MLTFFRRIRKGLLEGGSTSKYSLYAIGEILLVMIGILLALQVNNWNEWRKERIIEKELVIGLYESVKNNHDILTEGLYSWRSTTRAIEIITNTMDNNLTYADSLTFHYGQAHRSRGNNLNALDFSGFKALENRGYNILSNKPLRKNIISLFEKELPKLVSTNSQVDFENSGFHSEYIVRNFTIDGMNEFPHDYNKIMKDRFYYSILKRLNFNLDRKIGRVHRTLPIVEQVLELLEQELENPSKK